MVALSSPVSHHTANLPLSSCEKEILNTAKKAALIGLAIIGTSAVIAASVVCPISPMAVMAIAICSFIMISHIFSDEKRDPVIIRDHSYRPWIPSFSPVRNVYFPSSVVRSSSVYMPPCVRIIPPTRFTETQSQPHVRVGGGHVEPPRFIPPTRISSQFVRNEPQERAPIG